MFLSLINAAEFGVRGATGDQFCTEVLIFRSSVLRILLSTFI